MRKFKLFIASMLTYFMAISLLPTSLLQTIAKAAENEYTTLVKSDYYLRAEGQYENSFLVAYGDASDKLREGKITISLVKAGSETVLKEIEGYHDVQIIPSQNDNSKSLIKVFKSYIQASEGDYYQEYDFKTNKFSSISKEKWNENYTGNPEYNNNTLTKELTQKIINKVNEEVNTNINIDDKYYEDNGDSYYSYKNDSGQLKVRIYSSYTNESIIQFAVDNKNYTSGKNMYSGVIFKDYIYVAKNDFDYIVDNNNMYIHEYTYDDSWVRTNDSIIKVSDGEFISSGKIDFYGEWERYLADLNNRLYFNSANGISKYKLEGNQYIFEENYTTLENSQVSINDNEKQIWLLEQDDSKVYISKIENNELHKVLDVTESVNKLIDDDKRRGYTNMKVFSNDNIMLVNYNGFAIIQKDALGEPSNPEEPNKPEEPNNPGDNGNVVVIPSDDKVIAEVSKINPNDKNEIKVNTEASAKKVEVLIKDVESLKSGTGSLNITINNGVTMNLPLSTIDKSLLEGADNVTIKLDVVENSDIIKQIKAVNKVFDFNLIINKGNESLNIHNFKDGLAEVTLNLTDEDLKELNKDKLVVYYYNDVEKTFEAMETVVNGNKITFKTPHFSKYVVAEKVTDTNGGSSPSEGTNDNTNNNTEIGKGNLPETGSVVSNNVILVLAIGIVAIGGIMFFRKRKHA